MTEDAPVHAGPGHVRRGYTWPPFTAGNAVATKHGAMSPRRRQPIEVAMVAWAHHVAPWTADPVVQPSVDAWARHEAMVLLLAAWIDANGIQDSEGDIRPAVGQLRRYEGQAAKRRAELGLDPRSKLALVRDEMAAEREQTDLAAVMAAGERTGDDLIDTTTSDEEHDDA